jgi:hypothetical protein
MSNNTNQSVNTERLSEAMIQALLKRGMYLIGFFIIFITCISLTTIFGILVIPLLSVAAYLSYQFRKNVFHYSKKGNDK